MPLKDYQDQVNAWANQFETPYWPRFQQLAHLSQEVGEVSRAISHIHGHEKLKAGETIDLPGELADVILTCIFLANAEKIDLDLAVQGAIDKKYKLRDNERYKKK